MKTNSKLTRNLIAQTNPKSPVSEQYRTIRTNIQFSNLDEEMQTIMVTSPNPSEGKSTIAANLAVVFAQQGKRTLLIDADLRKPTAHYTFSVTNTEGLTTVLMKRINLADAIKQTPKGNLYILPSGPIPPNPSELISSKSMVEIMEKVKGIFEIIILDTPPVLPVTDSQILGNICNGIILVVKSGSTEIKSAQKAKDLLSNVSGKLLGVIINQKKLHEDEYYYKTYYAHDDNKKE